jgi:small nuclear ribonucleoprotein (snRNP)-like protein
MIKKRGSSKATNIATLVFLIGLFIIFYVLLIPEESRRELLGEDFTKGNVPAPGYGVTPSGKVLLTSSPGKVYSLEKGLQVIPMAAARLYVRSEDDTIDIADKVLVSKGLFSEDAKTLYFKIDNPSSVSNLNLFFFVPEPSKIYVELNGNRVFDGQIQSADLPINLPLRVVRKDNTLKIGLSGTYVLTKSVELTSVSIKEAFTVENRVANRNFVLSTSERSGLKGAHLNYFVSCRTISPSNQGELTISLNGNMLFSDYVVCDAGPQVATLDTNDIKSGTNVLSFEISKGDYSIENMEVVLDVSDKYYPQYSFDLSDDDYNSAAGRCDSSDYDGCSYNCGRDCRDSCGSYTNYDNCYASCFDDCENDCFNAYCSGARKLILQLEFPNNKDRKIASITVNKEVINIDTSSDVFFSDISSAANRGANYIKIVAKNDFEIKTLTVSLEPQT